MSIKLERIVVLIHCVAVCSAVQRKNPCPEGYERRIHNCFKLTHLQSPVKDVHDAQRVCGQQMGAHLPVFRNVHDWVNFDSFMSEPRPEHSTLPHKEVFLNAHNGGSEYPRSVFFWTMKNGVECPHDYEKYMGPPTVNFGPEDERCLTYGPNSNMQAALCNKEKHWVACQILLGSLVPQCPEAPLNVWKYQCVDGSCQACSPSNCDGFAALDTCRSACEIIRQPDGTCKSPMSVCQLLITTSPTCTNDVVRDECNCMCPKVPECKFPDPTCTKLVKEMSNACDESVIAANCACKCHDPDVNVTAIENSTTSQNSTSVTNETDDANAETTAVTEFPGEANTTMVSNSTMDFANATISVSNSTEVTDTDNEDDDETKSDREGVLAFKLGS